MTYIIPSTCEGLLLRTYLCRELGLSHRLLARLKATEGGILLDGQPVTVRAVVHGGSQLTLALEDVSCAPTVTPSGVMPPIVYEDDDMLVCNKPGTMPTHPSHGHTDDTLANAVAAYDMRRDGRIRVFHPITRLDRETSGIVLIARGPLAAARLSDAMHDRRIQKTYLAVLDGHLPQESGTIDAYIRRAHESIILRTVCHPEDEGAHAALTHYRTLATWMQNGRPRSLVEARPETGRTHQLRVHFAHMGAPIAGDGLYGVSYTESRPPRQCLHAYSLTLHHPTTGEPMTLTAPLAHDILRYIPEETVALLDACLLR